MASPNEVDGITITGLAVAVGRVEEGVSHIRSNTEKHLETVERRLSAGEKFQLTTQNEFNDVHGRISNVDARVTAVESSLATTLKWITGVVSVVGIAVTVIIKVLP